MDGHKAKADYVFECSWEVCNKVGGIYTVILSKTELMRDHYPNYFLIGPYVEENAKDDFVEEETPPMLKAVFDDISKEGIRCRFGMWQIKGEPKVILIDFKGFMNSKNDIKARLWNDFKIDSLKAQWDFEEPLLWATAVGKLIEKFCLYNNKDNQKKVVAQFHEWMTGIGLLYLKGSAANKNVKVATVFTTHATMLGRSIAGSGEPLYEMLESMNPTKEAYDHGVADKHLTEVACAKNCDIFTTVSEITSIEAEKILGRKADVLVLNGLDIEKFPTYEECAIKHRKNREIIREFVAYYFFPHYYFDLEHTLFFFIVGRYEFKNKGIDVTIKALGRLNEQLKAEHSNRNIVVFFWIPRDVHGAKEELPENKANFHRIEHFIERNRNLIMDKAMMNILKCPVPDFNDMEKFNKINLFHSDFMLEAKQLKINFMKKGNPLVTTHNLPYESQDILLNSLLAIGLDNKEDDKVKVIYYPVYLTGVDGLIDLQYYDAIMGCHLGLFPSYYEPWGYTPLESAALGVPSLTTDLGGFGRFLMNKEVSRQGGIFILNRFHKTEDEVVSHFSELLYRFVELDQKGRVYQKMLAKETAGLADWKELIKNYFEAYKIALKKKFNITVNHDH